MGIDAGRYTCGPGSDRLSVKRASTGLGARAGHDLTIEVARWECAVTVDGSDLANSAVCLDVEADSLAVREGTGGIKPLTGPDRSEIDKAIHQDALQTGQHPAITFRSTRVEGNLEQLRVDGDLAMLGVTRTAGIDVRLDGRHVRSSATITQSRWRIRPYSAFFAR